MENRAKKFIEEIAPKDPFSQWLGVKIIDIKEGYSKISMFIRPEMLNAFGIVHGGITFAFGDTAFAYACTNRNEAAVALDVSISFTKAVSPGETIFAEAKEMHHGRSTGMYLITITNESGKTVAVFKGTCFKTGKKILP